MDSTLKDLLFKYQGELMYDCDNCFDWAEKDTIKSKIHAINVLLDMPSEHESWLKKVINKITGS